MFNFKAFNPSRVKSPLKPLLYVEPDDQADTTKRYCWKRPGCWILGWKRCCMIETSFQFIPLFSNAKAATLSDSLLTYAPLLAKVESHYRAINIAIW